MFDEFRAIAGDAADLLRLYHLDPSEGDTWLVERTHGHKNIVEKATSQPVPSATMIEAGWIFGPGTRHAMICEQYCRQGLDGNHTGTNHLTYDSESSYWSNHAHH